MTTLGILSDIHGDMTGFYRALRIFERAGVSQILCAGDIVDRGADADRVVALLQRLPVTCIKGNHEHTIIRSQQRWRKSERRSQLQRVGRVISDETLAYIEGLPTTARVTIQRIRLLVAHGTPWSDVIHVYPDSRQSLYEQLLDRYGSNTDILILGHTHKPMWMRVHTLTVLNPGSVYGVTARDSATCATLKLPEQDYRVFDLKTGDPIAVFRTDT